MKNKKLISIIVIIIAILILAGGVCGYLYYGTDTFKSDKDKFFKYFAQNKEILEIFEDEWSTKYVKKQQETPFENNGEIKINSNIGEESVDNILENIGITYSGKVDIKNKKTQEDISINYESDKLPFTFIQNDEKIGIKADWTDNKYIALENNNLKNLAEKLGIKNTDQIPNKIDFNNLKEEFFTEEELKNIKKTYGDILTKEFENEDFSKITENNQEAYKLTITDTKLKCICTKLLEELKNDNIILEKIAKSSNEKYTAQKLQEEIEKVLEEIKDGSTEDKEVIYITVYKEKGKLSKTEISFVITDDEAMNVTITKNDTNAQIEAKVLEEGKETSIILDITKVKEDSNLKYNIELNFKQEDEFVKAKGIIEYNNIKDLKEFNGKYTFGIESSVNGEDVSIDLIITSNNKFVDNMEIDSLDDATLINDMNQEEITTLFSEVGEKLGKVLSETNIVKEIMNSSALDSITKEGDSIYLEDEDYTIEENTSEDIEENEEDLDDDYNLEEDLEVDAEENL